MATSAGWSGRRRQFAAACGVLSRCVRAEAAAGNNKMTTEEAHNAPPAVRTRLLMPGADVAPDAREEEAAWATLAPEQLTIMHGGRVMVFDGVPAHKVAELVCVAAAGHGRQGILGGMTDVPVAARKGSLKRFLEKRQDRIAGRSPYAAALEKGIRDVEGSAPRPFSRHPRFTNS